MLSLDTHPTVHLQPCHQRHDRQDPRPPHLFYSCRLYFPSLLLSGLMSWLYLTCLGHYCRSAFRTFGHTRSCVWWDLLCDELERWCCGRRVTQAAAAAGNSSLRFCWLGNCRCLVLPLDLLLRRTSPSWVSHSIAKSFFRHAASVSERLLSEHWADNRGLIGFSP